MINNININYVIIVLTNYSNIQNLICSNVWVEYVNVKVDDKLQKPLC